MFLSITRIIFRPIFGTFETEELKKFLRMGVAFSFVIGSYWTMRILKNALFCSLVGAHAIPYAKTLSLLFLIPFLMLYTKLIDTWKYEKTFYTLSSAYTIMLALFAALFALPGVARTSSDLAFNYTGIALIGTHILGYAWYVFVESYASLVITLFWAIATNTTLPDSANRGFPLIVAIGQIGGIICPVVIGGLPYKLGMVTNALSLALCALTISASMYYLKNFLHKTPKNLLIPFKGSNEKKETAKQQIGPFEGFKLITTHRYPLAIFAVISFFEIIVTIFDMHFQMVASEQMTGTQLARYMGTYGSWVNIFTLLFLLMGISNITRILGVSAALFIMPAIYSLAIAGFVSYNSLNFLFFLMVSSKALNYALSGPAEKQLYIPTTPAVRFKAQAWLEAFGARGAKEAGSIFNMFLCPLQAHWGKLAGRVRHIIYSAYLGSTLIIIWFIITIYLGKTYQKAVDTKKVIC